MKGQDMNTSLCSDTELQALMQSIQSDEANEIQRVDQLLAAFPDDPRLHFLRGSLLAGIGRSIEAMPALRRAVELAPDFHIARFQLGFFQLTSAEAANALSTWGPLALLPEGHYLRAFVAGLTYLIRDEFPQAIEHLQAGIAANAENPPLNRDMQLIADQIGQLGQAEAEPTNGAGTSAASFLLDQFASRGSKH
jgi:tetratricopeptide (TPR) repeat protein